MEPSERIRQAARDGYLEILRNATRKECNSSDEDGMTATHWAAYTGNLSALRIIVGRGGDPEKCDYFGNTALHWSSNNGHYQCVSFLISFGVNLWSMDNEYHTAKDLAALNNRMEIVQLIDNVLAQQCAFNTKEIMKLKEKARSSAEKRIKLYRKLQNKTIKQAEKEEKLREKQLKKSFRLLINGGDGNGGARLATTIPDSSKSFGKKKNDAITDHRRSINHQLLSVPTITSSNGQIAKFSDLVGSTTKAPSSNRIKIFSGVSRKVLARKLQFANSKSNHLNSTNGNRNNVDNHFQLNNRKENIIKLNESYTNSGSCRSIKSMFGIQRDDQIVYVPKFNSLSVSDLVEGLDRYASYNDPTSLSMNGYANRLPLKEVFNQGDRNVANTKRTVSSSTFTKHNIGTTLKNKLFKLNRFSTSRKHSNDSFDKMKLYRTISEPDFLQKNRHHSNEMTLDESISNRMYQDSTISGIFERPGFGSVSFRGKFTPELMFSSTHRLYDQDNSEDDDEDHDELGVDAPDKNLCHNRVMNPEDDGDDCDSGHERSHQSSQSSQNMGSTNEKNLKQPMITMDGDSFASDSIGSAGSLCQDENLNDNLHFHHSQQQSHLQQQQIYQQHQHNHVSNSHQSHYHRFQPQQHPVRLTSAIANDYESRTVSVLLFLYAHGLKDYYEIFENEKIDIEAMMLLNESDLIALGIPLGPRRKLINAIEQRKRIIENHQKYHHLHHLEENTVSTLKPQNSIKNSTASSTSSSSSPPKTSKKMMIVLENKHNNHNQNDHLQQQISETRL
ncbi:85/88 kDa calcium-independent phospholipase A2 [Sarcoptes scabiei]|nr:85/88 kDa calcium-independent phospholipase A2 [Sarcoptes scabiei]